MLYPFVISSLTIPGPVISVLVALGLLFTLAWLFDVRQWIHTTRAGPPGRPLPVDLGSLERRSPRGVACGACRVEIGAVAGMYSRPSLAGSGTRR